MAHHEDSGYPEEKEYVHRADEPSLKEAEVPSDEETFTMGGEQESDPLADEPRVNVGLHPLGGIGISVRGADGQTKDAQISIDEAWATIGHLTALTSMLVGSAYAQAAMEQQRMSQLASEIIMPPGHKG